MMTNVMVKKCLNHKIRKNSNLIHAMKNYVWPKATVIRRPNFCENRICPKIYRMFRSVDWTHDMIIVKWQLFNISESRICPKIYRMFRSFRSVDWTHDMVIVRWHLFIWRERKLCALTNVPPVQSTQTGQWLSTLFHARRSGLCLVPSAIHLRSKLQATIIFAGITIHKKDILKNFFVYLMMTNVMVKTCLNQKIIKNSNLIQAMKNNVCPKATVIRRPNFSENRICLKIYRMFRSVDWRHDIIIVKWREVTVIQFFRKPNLSEYLPNVPKFPKCGLNTRHDNREVTWSDSYSILTKVEFVRIFAECSEVPKCGLNTRHDNREVTLIHLTRADTSANFALWQMRHRFNPRKWVNDYQRYSMLGAQVYVLCPRQFIFALSCKRRSFLQVLQSIRRIFWKTFCVPDDDKCHCENMS